MGSKKSGAGEKRIIGVFPDLLGLGGIQEASRQTVTALDGILSKRGWSAAYLGLNDSAGGQTIEEGDRHIPIEGFERNKIRFVYQVIAQVRADARIILAAHPNLAVVAQMARSFSPQVKIIVLSHGVEIWERLPWYRRNALLSADIVVATSRYSALKLVEVQKVASEKIRLLPWPLSSKMLQMADCATKPPLPEEFPRGRVIITVGRWAAAEGYKGADELIRAMARLLTTFLDLSLVVVGGGDDLPRLRQIAADLGVTEAIHFLDQVSFAQLAACYAFSEIFALPSTGEGFGLVFLEAMAFGKAIVGVDAGGSVDLIEDNVNGLLVPPRDTAALVSALDRLLRDNNLRAELGRQGAEIVRRKYRFDVFQRQLENVLLECGLNLP